MQPVMGPTSDGASPQSDAANDGTALRTDETSAAIGRHL
jgi:hypothetical protein